MLKNYNLKKIIIAFIIINIIGSKYVKASDNISETINLMKNNTKNLKKSVKERKKETLMYNKHLDNMYKLFEKREQIKNSKSVNRSKIKSIESMINYTTTFDESYFERYYNEINIIDNNIEQFESNYKKIQTDINKKNIEKDNITKKEFDEKLKFDNISAIDSTITLKNKELNKVNEQIKSANLLLNEKQQTVEKIEKTISHLNMEYNSQKSNVEQLNKEINELNKKINDNKIINNLLEQEIEEKNKILDDFKTDENNFEKNTKEINKDIDNNEIKNKSLDTTEVILPTKYVNDINKIIYVIEKNLILDIYNIIDYDIISYFSIVDDFRFSFYDENMDMKKFLYFKSDINKFVMLKNIKFNRYDNFGFIVSYNDINTTNLGLINKTIRLDSKNAIIGIYLKHFIIKYSSLFTNTKLLYGFSKNKYNLKNIGNYNQNKFNSQQISLQVGFGNDLKINKFFKLSLKFDVSTIFIDIDGKVPYIEDGRQDFNNNNMFIAMTPSIFFGSNRLNIFNNLDINFGINLSYDKALSSTKMIVNGEEKNIDKDILNFGINTDLFINNNINFSLNYSISKTKNIGNNNIFGIGGSIGFWF